MEKGGREEQSIAKMGRRLNYGTEVGTRKKMGKVQRSVGTKKREKKKRGWGKKT